MERLFELGRLLDYYGDFLTDRQRNLLDAYVNENLSLAELAEREGISRQGVRDGLVRAERQLTEMEEHLKLIEHHTQLEDQLHRMQALADTFALTEAQRDGFNRLIEQAFSILEDEDGI